MLDFEDEDDEGEVRREFEGLEEMRRVEEHDGEDEDEGQPSRRGRRPNGFIDHECGGVEERPG